jgi:hypothetical protein
MENMDLKKFANTLELIGGRLMPAAARAAINGAAFDCRENARVEIQRRFILRNQWTLGSLRVNLSRAAKINQIESRAGTLRDYLQRQEEGATRSAAGGGVSVPTSATAGQEGATVRTRVQRPRWRAKNIRVRHFAKSGHTPQDLTVAVRGAMADGTRLLFIDSGGRTPRGIYRVKGGRLSGRGWPRGMRLVLIRNLAHRSITIRPNKWMAPAEKKAREGIRERYAREVKKILSTTR